MKVVIALDSFKGSVGSIEAGEAVARGVLRADPNAECVVRPLADGGEGTVDALVDGLGGVRRTVQVTGPDGRQVSATYGLLPENTAVIEMAAAAGLPLVGTTNDVMTATTYGVGELVLDAIWQGAKTIVMGIGGSATNDGGAGMLQALGFGLLDESGKPILRGGAALSRLAGIVPTTRSELCDGSVRFRVACDVKNPLCGPNGASAVFGPQKGATREQVAVLDAALSHFAKVAADANAEVAAFAESAGAGAAGGLGFALKAFLGAELLPGVELVLLETRLDEYVSEADVVVTGEGRLDGQTVMGKAPIGVAELAKRRGAKVVALSGCLGDGVAAVNDAGIDAYFPILGKVCPLEEAMACKTAVSNLERTAEQVFRLIKL